MSNDTSNTILKAIETMVKNEVNKLQADITDYGVIKKLANKLERKYEAIYQGVIIYLYAKEGDTYNPGEEVYFVIPKGDISGKKIIQGLKGAPRPEPFNTNGPSWNIIYEKDWAGPYGLNMGPDYSEYFIYDASKEEDTQGADNELQAWSIGASQFAIRATFWTKIYKIPQIGIEEQLPGKYGIKIILENSEGDEDIYCLEPTGLLEQVDLYGEKMTITRTFAMPSNAGAFKKLKKIIFYQEDMDADTDTRSTDRWNLLVKDIEIGYVSGETTELYSAILRYDDNTLTVQLLDRMNSNDFFEEQEEYATNNVRIHFYQEHLYSKDSPELGFGWKAIRTDRALGTNIFERNSYVLPTTKQSYQKYKAIVVIHLTQEMKNIIAANTGISATELKNSIKFITNEIVVWGNEGPLTWAAQLAKPETSKSRLELNKFIYESGKDPVDGNDWKIENKQFMRCVIIKEDNMIVFPEKNDGIIARRGLGLSDYKDYKNYKVRAQCLTSEGETSITLPGDQKEYPCYGFWEWDSYSGSVMTYPTGTKVI